MAHVRSVGALIFGIICLSGTIIVLFGHVRSFDDLTINHLYIILALTVTLGSGHFMWDAYAAGWLGIARGLSFTLLFAVGTVVCVGLSGGRSAAILAQRDYDQAQAQKDIDAQRLRVTRALDEVTAANAIYQQRDAAASAADAIKAQECNGGKGTKCEGKKTTADDARRLADQAFDRLQDAKTAATHEQSKLDTIHLPPPPNTDLLPFAQLYAMITHITPDEALAKVKLLLPYAFAVITEFGTVAFFQHGFGKPTPKPSSIPTVTIAEIAQRVNMKPDEARKKARALGIQKSSAGWIFTATEAAQIQQRLSA